MQRGDEGALMTRRRTTPPSARPDAAPITVTVRPEPEVARLFVVDLCGASLSAVLSGVLLPSYANQLGVAESTLHALAAVAVVLAVSDAAYLVFRPRRWRAMLLTVAVGNLAYPFLALAVSAADDVAITTLGAALLAVESLVVVALGCVQLLVASRSRP